MESALLESAETGKQYIESQNEPNSDTKTKYFTSVTTIDITESNDDPNSHDDILILRKDPTTKRNLINKSAYAKLHRSLSPSRTSSTIDSLKEKYENNKKLNFVGVKREKNSITTDKRKGDGEKQQTYTSKTNLPVKLNEETVQSLKKKYSPGSFGYPKTHKSCKLPVPKPRSAVKSQIIFPSSRQPDKNRLSFSPVGNKVKPKDENSNEVYRKNSSSSGEFITIITRSESEASVDKFEKELNLFTMDGKPKEKKRTSSLKKIFSGRLFGKDKKKKEEEENKLQYKETVILSDNLQNESNSFNRRVNYRHTTDGASYSKPHEVRITRSKSERFSHPRKVYITKDMEEKYAQMHINQFNHIKQTFESAKSANQLTPQGYVSMNKPIVKNNPGPINYMNLPNVKNYIDSSSSDTTVESETSNLYQNSITKEQKIQSKIDKNSDISNTTPAIRFQVNKDISRDTPPRAQELRQGVRLVNPKALLPINSERPLPNPYQNGDNCSFGLSPATSKTSFANNEDNFKSHSQPYFEETYGIVFDSLETDKDKNRVASTPNDLKINQVPPKSPSLESTKLKLPPNREIIPLSPRIKSPIPHDNVSAEKIIATELLKPTKSPSSPRKNISKLFSPSHQRLEIDIDYPDNITSKRNEKLFESISSKPPMSRIPLRRSPEISNLTKPRYLHRSPSSDNERLNESIRISENYGDNYPNYTNSQGVPENLAETNTTNVMVHVNSQRARTSTPNNVLRNRSSSPMRPQSVRSSTPVDVSVSPSTKSSPQKEDMRKSVEAYYWKEIKKLKERENYDLYVYQMQVMPYSYAEDSVGIRRSRSLSPTAQRNSRSLSLPRDSRSSIAPLEIIDNSYGRMQPNSIPEGRALINQHPSQRNIVYGQVQDYQLNFKRNTPERRTTEGTGTTHSLYKPIFKRGSLTAPVQEYPEDLQNKKVSFSSSRSVAQNINSWPTKNGFMQSPPQRRLDNSRRNTLEDDVFLPVTPRTQSIDVQDIYGYVSKPSNMLYDNRPSPNNIYQRSKQNQEPIYTYSQNPNLRYRQEYGQPQEERMYGETDDLDSQSVNIQASSVQMQEPLYDQKPLISRRMSYDNANLIAQRRIQEPQYVNRQQVPPRRDPRYGFKREIIVTDEIFGQFGGYIPHNANDEKFLQSRQIQNPLYSSRQSVAEPIYERSGTKQVSVSDKVCDMYGQIHDRESSSLTSPYQIKRTGVILGEFKRSPGSPQMIRQSYSYIPTDQFVRNSRLTASANDMYRRYQRTDSRYPINNVVYGGTRVTYHDNGAPTRPLPPVPAEEKLLLRNNSGRSHMGRASDANEMPKVVNSDAKNKKRSFFGK